MSSITRFLLHTFAILFALTGLYRLSSVIVSTGLFSPSLLIVLRIALPVSLFVQTMCIAWFSDQYKRSRVWVRSDLASIAIILLLIAVLQINPAIAFGESSTGLLVGFVLIARGILLLLFTSKLTKKAPSVTISFLLAVFVVTLIVPVAAWRLASHPLSGDEPYYLLISYSLIHDKNLNLEENYLHGDSLSFTHTRLTPQMFDSYKDGKLLSRHPPFLPLLLIPGFLIGHAAGAVYTMVLFGTLLALGLCRLMKQFGLPADIAVWAAALTSLTAPALLYSTAVFTELPAAVMCVWILSLTINLKKKPFLYSSLALILAIAATALKTRFIVLCLPPVITGLLMQGNSRKIILRRMAVVFSVLVILGLYNIMIYGSITGRYNLTDIPDISIVRIYRGFTGLLFDQQYGLFSLNPLFLLAIPGIYYMFKLVPVPASLVWVAAVLPYYSLVALFAELSGGICPRGRFVVAWTPLLAVPAAIGYHKMTSLFAKSLFYALLIVSVIITFFLVAFPDWQIVHPGSTDTLLSTLSETLNTDLLHVIPSFDRVDETLVKNGILLLGLCFAISLFPGLMERITSKHRKFGSLSSGLCLALVGVVAGFTAFSGIQTPWMHAEDTTFAFRGNTVYFWEEPFYWDHMADPCPSPYRSGARLSPGSSVLRKQSLRYPFRVTDFNMNMEIVARASYPAYQAPLLEITAGRNLMEQIQIRSTDFRSYIIPWPYGTAASIPELGFHYSRYNDPRTFIDIDKIRIVSGHIEWSERPYNRELFFPVYLGPLTLHSVSIQTSSVVQGTSFTITSDMSSGENSGGHEFELLFLSGTRAYRMPLDISVTTVSHDIQVTIPPEFGSGLFDILISGRNKRESFEFLEPEGLHVFTSGKRAWIGNILITAAPVETEPVRENIIVQHGQDDPDAFYFLEQTGHLSKHETVAVSLSTNQKAVGLVIVSHLSSVFEQIPWEAVIGTIQVHSADAQFVFDVVLGRHTAEDLYEFDGKDVRLSHPQPTVARYLERELRWPLELEGMTYNAPFYIAWYRFDTTLEVERIVFSSNNFPGVWNIYSAALMTVP